MYRKIRAHFYKNSLMQELASKSLTGFFYKIFSILLSYAVVMILSNNYGAGQLGLFVTLTTITMIFTMLSKFGMDTSVLKINGGLWEAKKLNFLKKNIGSVIIFTFSISVIMSLILYLSSDLIQDIFEKQQLGDYVQLMSITVITGTMISIVAAIFQSVRKIKEYAIFGTILVHLIFIILLFLEDNMSVILKYVISNLIAFIISGYYFFLFVRSINKQGNSKFFKGFSKVLRLSYPMLISSSFILVMSWTDVLMIGYYMNSDSVGIFSSAQRTGILSNVILSSVGAIAGPIIAQLHRKDKKKIKDFSCRSTRIIFYLSLPIIIVTMVFSESILGLFGDEFITGVTVLKFVLIAQLVNVTCGVVGSTMQMTGNHDIFKNVMIMSAIINIALNYFLIPSYGIEGAAFATMLSMIIWNIALAFFVKLKLGFWMPVFLQYKNKTI
jgi:O-antigen/teichoic acid export membrane protein